MTGKTRSFIIVAAAVLVLGLGGGLIAYLRLARALPNGLPPEVRYVPANAEVVAFADVKAVMNSELRRQLMPAIEGGPRRGGGMMTEFAGIDLEKQVSHVVAYIEPYNSPDPQAQTRPRLPHGVVMAHGTFDPARIEKFVTEQGVAAQDYKGRKIFVHNGDREAVAVAIVSNELIALGQADLVRRVIDQHVSASPANITDNADMMNVIGEASGRSAWVVAQFDAVRQRMRLPAEVGNQVPPLRIVSAMADVNGGIKATVRADAGDQAAAQQLRDVVRGFISLARLHASGQSDMEAALKSVELTGTDKTVRLSFAMSPETFRAIAPRRGGPGRGRGPNLQELNPRNQNPGPGTPNQKPAP